MVMLAVEITNLGPDKRAHRRERVAIVAVYGHKGQGGGQAGLEHGSENGGKARSVFHRWPY
jgi:hypothetical protein